MSGNEKRGKAVRGFVRGVLWGSLAAAGGLVVVSQVAGPVQRTAEIPGDAMPLAVPGRVEPGVVVAPAAPEALPDPASSPEPAAPQEVKEPAPDVPATPEAPVPEAPATESDAPAASANTTATADLPVMPAPVDSPSADSPAAQSQTEAPAAPQADSAAVTAPPPAQPPVAPPTEAPSERMATAGPISPPPDTPAPGDAPMATAAPGAPGLPQAEGAPAPADLPPPPPLTPEEEALLLPLPDAVPEAAPEVVPETAVVDPTPEPMPLPVPEAELLPPEGQGSLTRAPELGDQVPGVVTGRLPRIGTEPAPDSGADPAAPGAVAEEDIPPLQRYARPFDNAAQKPLFAILLVDDGRDGVNRADLAALDMPLSIVIDPLSDGAAERAAIWRAGGQEVVMAGSGIPQGAGPGDLEQSFQVLATRLPEAVAVIDADGTAFQNDRPLAGQVVPVLAEQGRGLVTFDQGLNAADQVARRAGLPAATIFRRIDAEDEGSPVIRRYLDRAAFKAAQEGRVIVIGTLRPETVAGVMEWAVEGRASTVALAPISAMLQAN